MGEIFQEAATTTAATTELTFGVTILTIFVTFALGILISITYMLTCPKGQHSKSFMFALVMVPAIIAIIILLVGSNIARAFSLAGAFSIIRFRSTPGDPKDISYVFFAMASGLACGTGLLLYACLFAVVLCSFMLLLWKIKFGERKEILKQLKIVIPEDLDYQGIFDDIFRKYTASTNLKTVKTTDLGSLYELVYIVAVHQGIDEKKFIDSLRCRNGNLNISLSANPEPKSYF
jgi:hypothetical protein